MPKLIQLEEKNLYCGGIPANVSNEIISSHDKNKIQSRPIILYGIGTIGLCVLKEFEYAGIPIAAVCDSHKTEFYSDGTIRPVVPLPEALTKYPDAYVLIVSMAFYDEIASTVQAYLPKDRILDIRELASELPDATGLIYRDYVIEHLDAFNWLAEHLEDDLSREVLQGVLLGRINREPSCFSRISSSCPYFTSDIVQLREEETFVDGGAYIGDTIADFLKESKGNFRTIFSFEPSKGHCDQIRSTYANLIAQDRLALFQNGLWSCRKSFRLIEDDAGSYLATNPHKEGFVVETAALDDCITEPVSFIKMDIESSELHALQGAQHLIRKYRPILTICVYHKKEDLLEIPAYIHSLQPGYRYYLRHHSTRAYETVFYAIPEERVKHN